MPGPIDISAYVICRDERDFLGACLDSLADFREIVVVDSGSTDGTLDLVRDYVARGFPIRLIERAWPGYAAQKQFALEQCEGPWCFCIDADERLTPELRDWLRAFEPGDAAAVAFRRIDYLPGYGYPPPSVHAQFQTRLVRRNRVRYGLDVRVHEGLEVDGPVRRIDGPRMLHYRRLSVAEAVQKALDYAELKARDMQERGRKASFASMTVRPLGRFLKYYVLQRFFLCGIPGLIYSVETAIYVFLSEAKLYRKSLGADAPDE